MQHAPVAVHVPKPDFGLPYITFFLVNAMHHAK